MRPLRFDAADAQRAAETWGANCGPGALAAICGLTFDELRPRLGEFEQKGYTTEHLVRRVLGDLGATFRIHFGRQRWPRFGLARIQWHGPWMNPGVPYKARYWHTHWVGSSGVTPAWRIFDINGMAAGGWLNYNEWSEQVVPWLLNETQPRATGEWSITCDIEVDPSSVGFVVPELGAPL